MTKKRKYKKKRQQRPIIRITADMLTVASLVCDFLILIVLIVWFAVERMTL